MRPSILFWVQHLLGVGHLARTAALADACAGTGMDAHIASGGPPTAHASPKSATLHQLPVLRAADARFSGLVGDDGEAAGEPLWQKRRNMLRDLVGRLKPAIVVLEHFPFGRRAFRAEITDLLQATASVGDCRTVVSVRDILVERQPKRWTETAAFIDARVDLVCVHSDPALVAFGETFPHADRFAPKIHHTGYVDLAAGDAPDLKAKTGSDDRIDIPEILVSTGGGPVGSRLRQVAAEMGTGPAGEPVRIRVGAGVASEEVVRLTAQATKTMTIEPNQPDFRARLRTCACSVSQAGYNTAVDLLSTDAPAVLVPFDVDGETEQALRADRLSNLGRAVVVGEQDLSVDTLRTAIAKAMDQRPENTGLDLTGAPSFAAAMQDLAADPTVEAAR